MFLIISLFACQTGINQPSCDKYVVVEDSIGGRTNFIKSDSIYRVAQVESDPERWSLYNDEGFVFMTINPNLTLLSKLNCKN